MRKLAIEVGTAEAFFARGRKLAHLADRGERLPEIRTLTFEDPADILALLTPARLALFRAVKREPGSLTVISQRLKRDRSAVKRDVDALAQAGLFVVLDKPLPGHGRMKEVRVSARKVSLRADVA
jgi:predicted transcriptional regulator